jgi:uncharacterized protein YjbI with pentapeptide repeats
MSSNGKQKNINTYKNLTINRKIMNEFGQNTPPEAEIEKSKKLTREEVEARLANGENLENLDIKDLDLAGLNLEGKSFRGSDIRGVIFYREKRSEDNKIIETRTNIKNADFTDAIIADLAREIFFGRVDAEGANFGYTEDLISRRNRHIEYKKSGKAPTTEDTGGLFNFNGSEGNFKKTKWTNVDFGGGSGYDAIFPNADLSEAEIVGSDLTEMDFSTVKIDGVKIKDPLSLQGMKINEQQISSIVQAIELTDEKERLEFLKEVKDKGPGKALEDFFGMIIMETKD